MFITVCGEIAEQIRARSERFNLAAESRHVAARNLDCSPTLM